MYPLSAASLRTFVALSTHRMSRTFGLGMETRSGESAFEPTICRLHKWQFGSRAQLTLET
jgi:hypothetical protein